MNDEEHIAEGHAEDIAEEVVERRMDWALGEVLGDERAPDVVMAVMTRRAAQLVEAKQVRVTGRGGPLLNAAVLVLGLVVVAWVMFAQRGVGEAGGQDPAPDFVVAATMAELAELPTDTRAVELRDLGNDGFVALAKQCPTLERLRLRGRGPDLRSFDVLGEDGGYGELFEADLTGCSGVQDVFVAKLIQAKTMTSIAIGGTDTSAAVVQFFEMTPQLRRIDFGEAPWLTLTMVEQLLMGGKRVVVRRPDDPTFERHVAELTKRYYRQIDLPYYRPVTTLDELRALPPSVAHIELRDLGDQATLLLAGRERLRGVAYIGDAPDLSEGSMRILGEMSQLEELRIKVPKWSGNGLDHLGALVNLRKLSLLSAGAGPMAWLANLAALREARLGSPCGPDAIGALTRCRDLEVLEIPEVLAGDDELARVGEMAKLRRLRLPGEQCGPQTIAAIGRLERLESLDLSCKRSEVAGRHPMPRLRPLGKLHSLNSLTLRWTEIEPDDLLALPVSLAGLSLTWCSGLDASAGTVLRDRFPRLLTLELNEPEWLDDDALRAILAAPALEHLSITNNSNITTAVVPAIVAAKNLRHLRTWRATFLDDAAAETLRRERPDLEVTLKVW
ncbi:MAG: hypothetical protein H6835_16635 [Planctomycetes bacterium]|nr:hypothetical protein [Planctomycetota bacterium]